MHKIEEESVLPAPSSYLHHHAIFTDDDSTTSTFQHISITDDYSVTVPSVGSGSSRHDEDYYCGDNDNDNEDGGTSHYIEFWEKVLLHINAGCMPRSPSCSKFPTLDLPLRSEFQTSAPTSQDDHSIIVRSTPPGLPLLHAVASLQRPLPSLVTFVLRLHPEQSTEKDERGYTPLHHALLSHNPHTQGGDDDERRHDIIARLVRANPACARIPYYDDGGDGDHHEEQQQQLPMTMALEQGVTWDRGIQEILYAHPDALTSCTTSTLLYPFMTAAVNNSRNTLTTVYELLRCFPELVGCSE